MYYFIITLKARTTYMIRKTITHYFLFEDFTIVIHCYFIVIIIFYYNLLFFERIHSPKRIDFFLIATLLVSGNYEPQQDQWTETCLIITRSSDGAY